MGQAPEPTADYSADEGPSTLTGGSDEPPHATDSVEGDEAAEAGSRAAVPQAPKKPTPSAPLESSENSSGTDDTQDDGYFSIRGEVIRQARGGQDLTIKICQAPRKGESRGRAFKLLLRGTVNRRAVGSFWDMHVQRQGNDLVIQEAIFIKDMPPTKRRGRSGPPRRGQSGPPRRRQDRPTPAVQRQGAAPARPVPKPVKRQNHSTPTE